MGFHTSAKTWRWCPYISQEMALVSRHLIQTVPAGTWLSHSEDTCLPISTKLLCMHVTIELSYRLPSQHSRCCANGWPGCCRYLDHIRRSFYRQDQQLPVVQSIWESQILAFSWNCLHVMQLSISFLALH